MENRSKFMFITKANYGWCQVYVSEQYHSINHCNFIYIDAILLYVKYYRRLIKTVTNYRYIFVFARLEGMLVWLFL